MTRAAGAERAVPLAAGGAPRRARAPPRPLPVIGQRKGRGLHTPGTRETAPAQENRFPMRARERAAAVGGFIGALLRLDL